MFLRAALLAFLGLLSCGFVPLGSHDNSGGRVQKNLISDYGATCNGVTLTRTVTIGLGSPNLSVTVNTFAVGDVGKTIFVTGAGSSGSSLVTTIQSFTDAQNIVLAANAATTLSAVSSTIGYGANDTTAILNFKAAFQGTTPVQLNYSGGCTFLPSGGNGQYPFRGIADLIVSGNGAATSSLINLAGSSNNFLLGGKGEYQDNAHSLRTNSASVGDSCVTVKTQPAVTVSGIAPNFAPSAIFTASAAGTTLTVTAVASGVIVPGAIIGNQDGNVGGFNTIQAYGTAGTTGAGGTGTYALSTTPSAGSFTSQTVNTAPASFTASVDANGVMTVSSIADGALQAGMFVFDSVGAFPGTGGSTGVGPTTISSQLTGTAGGAGTYQLDHASANSSGTVAVSSRQFQAQGQIRVTLNSTSGLSSGDTLYLSGVTGRGPLPQRVNGLKWIKVIDGTHIDIFQWVFDGSYTSGGTGGGDRTSLTPAGSKVMMSGFGLQSYWGSPYGFPSNQHWFEYLTVLSTNSTSHQICFTTPLTNSYKDTWPQYNTGSQFEVDAGGPATLYALDPSWELNHVYQDFTLDNSAYQTTANGRNVTYRRVAFTGIHCAIPSQNELHVWDTNTATFCNIETDKLVKKWNITRTSFNLMTVQSSSMDEIDVDTVTVKQWAGTPKKFTGNNFTTTCSGCIATNPGLQVGTAAYGQSDEFSCTNCDIENLLQGSGPIQQVNNAGLPWSMSGGIITIPNGYSWNACCNVSELQIRGMVPGHYAYWKGNTLAGRSFKIVDVTQDLLNTYVQTSEAGGFPTGAWSTSGLSVVPHPAPKFTMSGTTGADTAISFNGCPAQTPMYSCQSFVYTGGASGGSTAQYAPVLWGALDTFTFTNNVPYTNTGALTFTTSRFGNWTVLNSDLTTSLYGTSPNGQTIINTKLPSSCSPLSACTRTLTQSGATNTQTGDTLTLPPTGSLFGGPPSIGGFFSASTPSDSPQVTIKLLTNQNLNFLLKRDLAPASNDNDPMWLIKVS